MRIMNSITILTIIVMTKNGIKTERNEKPSRGWGGGVSVGGVFFFVCVLVGRERSNQGLKP